MVSLGATVVLFQVALRFSYKRWLTALSSFGGWRTLTRLLGYLGILKHIWQAPNSLINVKTVKLTRDKYTSAAQSVLNISKFLF